MIIMLISSDGKKIGDIDIDQARKMAELEGKNLVRVGKNNTYRIIDSGKLQYEQNKKKQKSKLNKKTYKLKEIKFKLTTDDHDMHTKLKMARKFLDKGMKIKLTMHLKGRQRAFSSLAVAKMTNFITVIKSYSSIAVDKVPTYTGHIVMAIINPSKKQS